MSHWARLDGKFHSNPKVLEAGDEGAGVYARSLSYCADHLTDGFVPARWLVQTATREQTVDALQEHELWEPVSKGARRRISRPDGSTVDVVMPADGYFIRDYLILNPSRAELDAFHAERRASGRKGALARWGDRSSTSKNREPRGNGQRGPTHRSQTPQTPGQEPPEEQGEHGTRRSSSHSPATKQPYSTVRNEEDQRLRESEQVNCPDCPLHFESLRRARAHLVNAHWYSQEQADSWPAA